MKLLHIIAWHRILHIPIAVRTIVLAFSAIVAHSSDRTPEQIKAAKEFAIDHIGLSLSYSATKRAIPTIERMEKDSDITIGLESWRANNTTNTDGLDMTFLDGKMMGLIAFYSSERILEMGGWDTIVRRVAGKIGKAVIIKAEDNELYRFEWKIQEINRIFRYIVTKKACVLAIIDIDLQNEMISRRSKRANTGF